MAADSLSDKAKEGKYALLARPEESMEYPLPLDVSNGSLFLLNTVTVRTKITQLWTTHYTAYTHDTQKEPAFV